MKIALILLGLIICTSAHPEAPIAIDPPQTYLPADIGPSISYGPPSISTVYGGPVDGYVGGYDLGSRHQDQKHVYFFAARDEDSLTRFRVYVQPSSQRNTRIIFVKAPSYGGIIPEVIAPPSQAEDRTKIYVLVKRPQAGGSITIPSSLGVKQARPEVYFIRYRNRHDAATVVSQGVHGGSVGTNLENLGSEQAFIQTLEGGRTGITTGITGIVDGITDGISIGGKYGPPDESGPYKKK